MSVKKLRRVGLLLSGIFAFAVVLFVLMFGTSSTKVSSERKPITLVKQEKEIKEVAQAVADARAQDAVFNTVELFRAESKAVADEPSLQDALREGTVLAINQENINKVLNEKPSRLSLPIPDAVKGRVELELIKVDLLTDDFTVVTSTSKEKAVKYTPGVHYRGIVKGDDYSLAAISVFGNEVMGFYNTYEATNNVIGRLGGKNPKGDHILYSDKDLKADFDFTCSTKDDGKVVPINDLQDAEAVAGACVRIYVEADYDIFQNKGSVANATDYITGVFNQSATLYANDGIPISLSQVFVWNSPSPYTGTSSSTLLSQFQQNRNSFNGDIGHLVAFRGNGGIAAGFNAFCNSNIDNRQCFSGIYSTYSNVPTYSWTVMVFTHEMGHLMGSRHTHACVWNGNGTAIDGCYTPEGSCSRPGNPSNGGTIMSYCHLVSGVGINLNNGFGPQPKNVILNRFNSATCLQDCGGGGCSYSISPTSASAAAGGGSGSVSVTTQSGCTWSATSNASWITVTGGGSGTGNGTVSYSVASNSGASRTGTVTIAGQTFTVSQAAGSGGCGGTSYTGSLSGTGANQYQPNGSYYYSSVSGVHSAGLTGPGGTDFDLYLQKWNGSSWATVARSEGSTSTENISYNGTAGYYRWRVYSYSGSGSYSLCTTRP